jgi:molecular chaperone DnaJ
VAKNFYKILGIDKKTSNADIKKAYRKLAKIYHPDKNPDDAKAEAKFKEISEAYEILSDSEKRKNYDVYGSADVPNFRSSPGQESTGGHPFDIFDDMFGEFFGGGSARTRHTQRRRGADVHVELEISFRDAIFGTQKSVRMRSQEPCRDCGTTGSADSTMPSKCSTCLGTGRLSQRQGFLRVNTICHTCHGRGMIPESVCIHCGGVGQVLKNKDVAVNIPPGVETGIMLRVAGKGQQSDSGGSPGNLLIQLLVQEDPKFNRRGIDIYSMEKITFTKAALGGSVHVETVHGSQTIKVPTGTQSGTTMRIRGKGVPGQRGHSWGHHYVQLDVSIPTRLTNEQISLIKKLNL